MIRNIKIHIEDRNYSSWTFIEPDTNTNIVISDYPELLRINPTDCKLFSRDIISVDPNRQPNVVVVHSFIKTGTVMPGLLQLEQNKTFGRTANKKRLLYKCIPDDKRIPAFLVPYDIKIGFSKIQCNKYVTFKFDHWNEKHPYGILLETLGDVNKLDVFYEYQLYCKSLHISITDFTNKTRDSLNKRTIDEYMAHIIQNPNFNIHDRRRDRIITIDPYNSVDFDDGLSIEELHNDGIIQWKVTVYIANVFLWLETLALWNSFSKRVATIYLPDRRRPMLPMILSDTLCSLQQNNDRLALAMDMIFDTNGILVAEIPITYQNVVISVSHNYHYDDLNMITNDLTYQQLFKLTKHMDKTIKTSNDMVAHWMIQMNMHTGIMMAKNKFGIFRSVNIIHKESKEPLSTNDCVDIHPDISEDANRAIRNWNNTIGQYVIFSEDAVLDHELISISGINSENTPKRDRKVVKSYVHVTSPIRRLVDLLNQMLLYNNLPHLVTEMSADASRFLHDWLGKMDYVNDLMKSIRKIQSDCELLNRTANNPDILEHVHKGVAFNKIVMNTGMISYMVYLEKLKLISRITTRIDLTNNAYCLFKIYLFEDEDKVKKKIRLQLIE